MKKSVYSAAVVCIFISFQLCFAQEEQNFPQNKEYNFVSGSWDNFKTTSSSAFSLKKHKNWEILAYIGLTAHFLFGTDFELQEDFIIEKQKKSLAIPRILGKIGKTFDKPGPIYTTIGLAGILYGTGKIFNDRKMVETTYLLTESLIITGIYTTALKVIIGRERPYTRKGPHSFHPFNFKFDSKYMSMPSGHTSSAFALMTVIAKQYNSWYVKIPAYTFAVSVAVQRMNADKHWASDLIIGGTLGYLIGSTVVKRHKDNRTGYTLQPTLSRNGIGLVVNF